jgi:trk system potassium uptake protein TrkH
MNRKVIIYTLGKMIKIEGLLLLLPTITGFIYKEKQAYVYLIMAILLTVLGHFISLKKPQKTKIFAREGFVIVALSWLLLSLFGAIPFFVTREIPSYIDAFFETVSGFTTTGSSILTDVESLSYASLFWRSFSHWIGGMGILVFVVAVLPESQGTTLHILQAEMPGPIVGKLVSKIRVTARILYYLYAAITALEIVFLLFGGMPLFDSIVHAFGTAGTGGFGIKGTSIAYYDSAYIDAVITVFMILFGINFNMIYFVVIGKAKVALKSEEVRWYLFIILAAAIAITINISNMYSSIISAFRYAIFQVASIITTTGYVTADYGQWPMFSQMIIILLMFVGACAGSTGGGIKISRIVIFIKSAFNELKHLIHPRNVTSVKFEGQVVHKSVVNNILNYLVLYLLILCVSLLLVSLQNIDFASTFSAVVTCLNNVGPGLNIVGPVGNFSSLTNLSKLVLCFDMLAGRLEIFPILLLFSKDLWKK